LSIPFLQAITSTLYDYYRILHEVLASEFRYLHQLLLLQKIFQDPLQEHQYIKDPDDFMAIFGQLNPLIKLHQEFINNLFIEKRIKADPTLVPSSSLYTLKKYHVSFRELTIPDIEPKFLEFIKKIHKSYLNYCKDYMKAKNLLAILMEEEQPSYPMSQEFLEATSKPSKATRIQHLFKRKSSSPTSKAMLSRPPPSSASSIPTNAFSSPTLSVSILSMSTGVSSKEEGNELKAFLNFTKNNQADLLGHLECSDYLYAMYQRPFRYQLLCKQLEKALGTCLGLVADVHLDDEEQLKNKTGFLEKPSAACIGTSFVSANPFLPLDPAEKPTNPFQNLVTPLIEIKRILKRVLLRKQATVNHLSGLLDALLKEANQAVVNL
jgi:RhoGEF domain